MLPGGVLPWEALEEMAAHGRIGWHLQLQLDGRGMEDRLPVLRRLPCDLVIDHTGKFLESSNLPDTPRLIEAVAGCDLIVGDVHIPAKAALFDKLPGVAAFHRCAADPRTLDLAAASRNAVLVTDASPGFISAVAELIFGLMIDLPRGITDAAAAYRAGAIPAQSMGVKLDGPRWA